MIREKILDYLTTTDAHKVGILYIVLAVINLILAGLMAFIIRLTIATTPPATNVASAGLVTGDVYYWVMSLHGLAMILLFAMQAVTGLANAAVPKLICAPDLYWPRINALSLWLQVSASVLMWSALFNAILAVAGHRPRVYGDYHRRHLFYSFWDKLHSDHHKA